MAVYHVVILLGVCVGVWHNTSVHQGDPKRANSPPKSTKYDRFFQARGSTSLVIIWSSSPNWTIQELSVDETDIFQSRQPVNGHTPLPAHALEPASQVATEGQWALWCWPQALWFHSEKGDVFHMLDEMCAKSCAIVQFLNYNLW